MNRHICIVILFLSFISYWASADEIEKQIVEPSVTESEITDLRKLWDYYSVNYEERKRDVAIEMIKGYIKKYPNTPFRAELYYRMGTLYASHVNQRFGESPNEEAAVGYYKISLELYGDYYSTPAHSMRSTFASMHQKYTSIERRVSYYKWLQRLKDEKSVKNIYPVNNIEAVLGLGYDVYRPENMQNFNWDNILAPHFKVAEVNIISACEDNLKDLLVLSEQLKGTPIGDEADKLLETNYTELKKMDTYPEALEKFLKERDERIRKQKEEYKRQHEEGSVPISSQSPDENAESPVLDLSHEPLSPAQITAKPLRTSGKVIAEEVQRDSEDNSSLRSGGLRVVVPIIFCLFILGAFVILRTPKKS